MGRKYNCSKLGEGSYADVFELKGKDAKDADELEARGGLIIKVIPFRVTKKGNDDIADLDSITREIQLFRHVDALHGFVRCRGTHIVSGLYPDVLLDAFHAFKATHSPEVAQNPPPPTNPIQLYALLEMNHAGTPIGNLHSISAFQVFDIFWKTAISLAHAERELQFEHRDLHNANICYKSRARDGAIDVPQEVVQEMVEKPDVILGLSQLEVTIIDYTLSRAKVSGEAEEDDVIFDKMEYFDREYTGREEDSESDKRQLRTYAAVRELAIQAEEEAVAMAQLEGREYQALNKYVRFIPKSNVLWLRYLLADLLARGGSGRGACLPGSSRPAKGLQLFLWTVLGQVDEYLNRTTTALLPASADEFIGTAVDKGWLAAGDVAAYQAQVEDE
jgi:serine/threonine-protein kinase haspin